KPARPMDGHGLRDLRRPNTRKSWSWFFWRGALAGGTPRRSPERYFPATHLRVAGDETDHSARNSPDSKLGLRPTEQTGIGSRPALFARTTFAHPRHNRHRKRRSRCASHDRAIPQRGAGNDPTWKQRTAAALLPDRRLCPQRHSINSYPAFDG